MTICLVRFMRKSWIIIVFSAVFLEIITVKSAVSCTIGPEIRLLNVPAQSDIDGSTVDIGSINGAVLNRLDVLVQAQDDFPGDCEARLYLTLTFREATYPFDDDEDELLPPISTRWLSSPSMTLRPNVVSDGMALFESVDIFSPYATLSDNRFFDYVRFDVINSDQSSDFPVSLTVQVDRIL